MNKTNVRSQITTACVCQAAVMNQRTYQRLPGSSDNVLLCNTTTNTLTEGNTQPVNEETRTSEVLHTDAFHPQPVRDTLAVLLP